MRIAYLLCFFFFFLCCPIWIFTQVEAYDLQFPYKGALTEINFDEQGYLWAHNTKDFYRFDGHQFEAVGISSIIDSREDLYNMYNRIIFNKDSLIFSHKKHISVVHPRTKESHKLWDLPEKLYLSYLYQDELGHLWVFAASWNNLERPVFKSENGRSFYQVLDLNEHIGDRSIFWDFFELNDKAGTLYFQWRLGDLLIIDSSGNIIELDVKDREVYESKKSCSQFRLDNNKDLWRIYEKDFEIYNTETKTFERHPISGRIEFVTQCKIDAVANDQEVTFDIASLLNLRSLMIDSEGRIWMGCAAAFLVCYDPSTDQMFNFRNEIVEVLEAGNIDIQKIIEDQDGNIWGISGGGLFKIRKQTNYFERYLVDTSEPNHPIHTAKDENPVLKKVYDRYGDYAYKNTVIHDIDEDKNGNLFFQSGILTFKLNTDNEVNVLPLVGPKESVFLSFNDQLKLFGVWNTYYEIEDDFQLRKLAEPILKIENHLIQKNGDIWVCGLLDPSNYLFGRLNKETLEFEGNFAEKNPEAYFSMKKVNSMAEDGAGNLLLGTSIGLNYLDLNNNEFSALGMKYLYQNDSIEIGQYIEQVAWVDKSRFWFTTQYEMGLVDIKAKTIEHLISVPGNSKYQSLNFLNQGDSIIWLGHDNGLLYHNFKNDYNLSISRDKGLMTNGAILSLKKLSNNKIAVGTNNGLYVFHPDSLLATAIVAEDIEREQILKFEGYSIIDGKTDSLFDYRFIDDSNKEIVLNYNDKMLSLDFSLINYNYPTEHKYIYQLEGYDDNWSLPSNKNSAEFTSLPPGSYKLNVLASGVSGIWSKNGLSIPLEVKDAWFRSYWFIILCALLLAGIIYLMTRYYFNQKIKRRVQIETLRQSISHDLHDDVGSILAGLSMQTEMLALDKTGMEQQALLKISNSSRNAMSKMRDIVWAMDFTRDKYENLIIRMKNFAQEQLGNSKMGYTFDVDEIEGEKFIKPNIRQNLYLIYKEALTNAIKHSNGSNITISLKLDKDNLLKLGIKDNGSAYDHDKTEGIGVQSMKKRASKIGADFKITTDEGYEVLTSLEV